MSGFSFCQLKSFIFKKVIYLFSTSFILCVKFGSVQVTAATTHSLQYVLYSCVQTKVWLPKLGIFNVRTDVNVCNCIWGLYGHHKSLHWKSTGEKSLGTPGSWTASAACQPYVYQLSYTPAPVKRRKISQLKDASFWSFTFSCLWLGGFLFFFYLCFFMCQSCFSETAIVMTKFVVSEYFYLVPLEKIDKMIDHKLEQIDKTVQWKPKFRVSTVFP